MPTRPHSLKSLLQANRKRGEFRAEGDTIFLYDVIVGSDDEAEWWGGVSPGAFARQLSGMSGTVHLRVNSPGGDVFAGQAMAQAIREYADDIVVHVDGLAASAASYVAIAGSKVVMAPGAMLMIHDAWTFAIGNGEELRQTAALLDKIDGSIAEAYAAKSGKPAADFAALMDAETWFTAQEAIDQGLADEIAEESKSKAKDSARWDLSAFTRPPAAETVQEEPDPAEAQPDPAESGPKDPQTPEPEPDPADAPQDDAERRIRQHAVRLLQTAD